jgi:hypothetical protein
MAKTNQFKQILMFRIILREFLGNFAHNPEHYVHIQDMFATLYNAMIQVMKLYHMIYSCITVVKGEAETNFEGGDVNILY